MLTDFVVTTSADSGSGSFRQAIVDANSHTNEEQVDRILFAIPPSDARHVYYQDDGVAGNLDPSRVSATTQAIDTDIADIDPDWPHSWYTVAPESPLPQLTDAVLIDAYSQPGASENTSVDGEGLNAVLRVEIQGTDAGVSTLSFGVQIASLARGSSIRGLAINRFTAEGFQIRSDNNQITGNFVGTDISGSIALGNQGGGVRVNESKDNQVGGTHPNERNLISGNVGSGVIVFTTSASSPASGNLIQGNLIGTDATGTQPLPNVGDGVHIRAGTNNVIGGAVIGARNIISGNNLAGIYMITGGSSGRIVEPNANKVLGNYIGLDITGSVAVAGQPVGGLRILGGVENIIGGTGTGEGNVIAGNRGGAIGIAGFERHETGNLIQGNLLGTDATGTSAVPNGFGINLVTANHTTIGGSAPEARNVISGNLSGAISVLGGGSDTLIEGNVIGLSADGTLPVGNGDVGIEIQTSNAMIRGNTIAHSGADGIRVNDEFDRTVTGVAILSNSIFGNAGLGIDLMAQQFEVSVVTFNDDDDPDTEAVDPDSDTGPNNLQNFPILTVAEDLNPGTRIGGTLASTPNSSFRLEFFATEERHEPSGSVVGQGRTLLGAIDVATDATGIVEFSVDVEASLLDLSGAAGQPFVTATATDITDDGEGPRNNTSEFSPVLPLGGVSFTVTNTGDIGIGTLREAITAANVTPGPQIVDFAIPADDPRHFYYRDDAIAGSVSTDRAAATAESEDSNINDIDPDWPHSWFSILPTRDLPGVVETLSIDGYTQPGARRNSINAPAHLDTALRIELNGSSTSSNGLAFEPFAIFSHVDGLAINRFPEDGIVLDTFGGNSVTGSFIGTDVSGTIAVGNGGNGITVNTDLLNRVGGTLASQRNLISGNLRHGIASDKSGADVYTGNLIGWDRTRSQAIGNGGAAFVGSAASFVTFGGTSPEASNAIAAVDNAGILFLSAFDKSRSSTVDSFSALEDCREWAMRVFDLINSFFDSSEPIGFLSADLESIIDSLFPALDCFDNSAFFQASRINRLLGNEIEVFGEGFGLAIDLNSDGVTRNDDRDVDGGTNELQNFPELTSAAASGQVTTVSGQINSTPESNFRIEFFANRRRHPSGFGPGERYLGFADVTTDEAGQAVINFTSPRPVSPGEFITSTATRQFDIDGDPNTPPEPLQSSEFSAAIEVVEDNVDVENIDAAVTVDVGLGGVPLSFSKPVSLGPNSSLELTANSALTTPGPHAVDIILGGDAPVAGTFFSLPVALTIPNGDGMGHIGHGLFFQGIRYNEQNNNVSVDVVQAALGDADGDGDVDFIDFLKLAAAFGSQGSWIDGNFNDDDVVDFLDFLSLANRFGQ